MYRKFIYVCLLMLFAGCTATAQVGAPPPSFPTVIPQAAVQTEAPIPVSHVATPQPAARGGAVQTQTPPPAASPTTPPSVTSSIAQNQVQVSSCPGSRVRR